MILNIVILALVTFQRVGELWLSNRNTARLIAQGAREHAPGHYPLIVALHAAWLACLWWLALVRPVDAFWLALFVLIVPLVMPLVFPQSVHRSNPAARPALSADVPPLEVTPSEDLQRHGHADRQFADTYGWIDRDRKIARIPVARAVDRLLQTGLPGWPSP